MAFPTIDSPEDLKSLPVSALPDVACALRTFLLDSINTTGGHLAASLGAVELSIALHYVFDSPHDKLIFDIGHQAHIHRLLTGRRGAFHTIKSKDGIAPFPVREESPHDAFGVGHSSTSISAAIGMAVALENTPYQAVAIIGDGAMTAGMAFEALNHAGATNSNILVILNDNDMSISPNVGALSNYFAKIVHSKTYKHFKAGSKKILERIPAVWELARKAEHRLKEHFLPGHFFTEMGFEYCGPVDGHDVGALIAILEELKSHKGPKLLHVITQKGKGYIPAEKDPITYHAVAKGFLQGISPALKNSYSDVFGKWCIDAASTNHNVHVITPAMREGSGLVEFEKAFPKQYHDVAIAEQHAVTLAAGMATQGLRPVVAIYSTFLQRAYDQLIHDVAIQNLPVLFAIDRAGLVPDGPTHCGSFDIAYLRIIPNMVIMLPTSAQECADMLSTGLAFDGPSAVRYPRDNPADLYQKGTPIPIGVAQLARRGKKIAILAFGTLFTEASRIAEKLDATLVNMRFAKPLDEKMILQLAPDHDFITIEDGVKAGGAGSAVLELLAAHQLKNAVLLLGIEDRFVLWGSRPQMLASTHLTEETMLLTITKWLAQCETFNKKSIYETSL